MLDFDHPNVLGLLGVCFDTDNGLPLIVLPYMANGDLKAYLQIQRRGTPRGSIPDVSLKERERGEGRREGGREREGKRGEGEGGRREREVKRGEGGREGEREGKRERGGGGGGGGRERGEEPGLL